MVRIRLKRMGLRHVPTYRVVAIEKRQAREGEYLEQLGHYDPRSKKLELNIERIDHWITTGAQPSNTVKKLISRFTGRSGKPTDVALGAPGVPVAGPAPEDLEVTADEAAADATEIDTEVTETVATQPEGEPEPEMVKPDTPVEETSAGDETEESAADKTPSDDETTD